MRGLLCNVPVLIIGTIEQLQDVGESTLSVRGSKMCNCFSDEIEKLFSLSEHGRNIGADPSLRDIFNLRDCLFRTVPLCMGG